MQGGTGFGPDTPKTGDKFVILVATLSNRNGRCRSSSGRYRRIWGPLIELNGHSAHLSRNAKKAATPIRGMVRKCSITYCFHTRVTVQRTFELSIELVEENPAKEK